MLGGDVARAWVTGAVEAGWRVVVGAAGVFVELAVCVVTVPGVLVAPDDAGMEVTADGPVPGVTFALVADPPHAPSPSAIAGTRIHLINGARWELPCGQCVATP